MINHAICKIAKKFLNRKPLWISSFDRKLWKWTIHFHWYNNNGLDYKKFSNNFPWWASKVTFRRMAKKHQKVIELRTAAYSTTGGYGMIVSSFWQINLAPCIAQLYIVIAMNGTCCTEYSTPLANFNMFSPYVSIVYNMNTCVCALCSVLRHNI